MGARPGHDNWDEMYTDDAPPPWEIGRPQPALAAVLDRISIDSPVLDVGCGTGELAISAAENGHEVVGIDCSGRAITAARAKAAERGVEVQFRVADAEHLEDFDTRPRTVLDSGLLHSLDDAGQRAYVGGLTSICDSGAVVCILAVSTDAGMDWGVAREGLSQLFPASDWGETTIETTHVLARLPGGELSLPSFLLTARRMR